MFSERWSSGISQRTTAACLIALGAVGVLAPGAVGAQSSIDDPAQLEVGQSVYESSCAGCHGADGSGTNVGRPLLGIAAQEADRLVHVASVTQGKGGMPAFETELSGDEIDAAVTYVRLAFSESPAGEGLPRTGTSSVLFVIAGSLLASGLVVTGASQRLGTSET